MKKLILLFIIVLLAVSTNAQTYHPFPTGSASWKIVRCFYFYQPGWHDEYTLTMDGTDTIHNGMAFKKITISNHHLPGTVNDTTYPTEFFGGLRELNKQIFIWKVWSSADTTVKLVYDFNDETVGDTIFTNVLTGNPNSFGHLITGKDSVIVGTQYHTRLHLQDPNNIYNLEDWIEGVGSSWGLPFATYWSATDNSYDLTCFDESQQLQYGNPNPIYSYCQAPLPVVICDSLVSSVSEQSSKDVSFNLYPNPSSGTITISMNSQGNEKGKISVKITDVLGQEIMNDKLLIITGSSTTIDMNDFAKGIYFMRIEDENRNVVNRKIVLQ